MENMSEIKTVTHEGNVYQIGQGYLFNDGGDYWHFLKLKRLVVGSPLRFEVWVTANKFTVFSHIKEVPASKDIGTLTPAPIELVDGAAYMFNIRDGKHHHAGIYDERQGIFSISQGQWVVLESATNTRLMTVGSE